MGQNPTTDRLVLHDDGIVYRHAMRAGKYRTYESDGVQIGRIKDIEKKQPDLLPRIEGYIRPEQRGIVPDPYEHRTKLEATYVDENGEKQVEVSFPLRDALAKIDNEGVIREMMRKDNRNESERFYLERLEELQEDAIAPVSMTATADPEVDFGAPLADDEEEE